MKLLSIVAFMAILFTTSLSATAQNYWAYDNGEFSVMLKCEADDTKVVEVSFAPITDDVFEWVVYKIVSSRKASKKEGNGTIYIVKSPEGVQYSFLYIKNIQKLTLIKASDKTKYTLVKGNG